MVDVAEPQPARRRGAIAVALSLGFVVLAAPGSAWAEPSLLGDAGLIDETVDPVVDTASTVTEVVEPVLKATKPVTDTVTAVVDPVTDTVDEVTKPVTDTVKTVTKPVTDTVKDVTASVTGTVVDLLTNDTDPGDTDPVGTDPTSPTHAADPSGDTEALPSRREAAPRTAPVAPPASTTSGRDSPSAVDAALARRQLAAEAAAVSDVGRNDQAQRATPSVMEEIRRGVEDAVEAFRFPLLLAAAVLLFLAIQRRLDARDPKLADAEGEQELTFA